MCGVGMLIKVDLSDFFSDHRAKALILLSKSVKYISGLEARIKEIFNFDDIYLSHEGFHLPSQEGIKLLEDIDIVKVRSKSIVVTDQGPIKKKKKRHKEDKEIDNKDIRKRLNGFTDDECSLKRKKPNEELENNTEGYKLNFGNKNNSEDSGIEILISAKKQKTKKIEKENFQEETSMIFVDENPEKASNKRRDSCGYRVKSFVENYENKLMLSTSKLPVKTFVPQSKLGKINIVKTIIVPEKKSSSLNNRENEINNNINEVEEETQYIKNIIENEVEINDEKKVNDLNEEVEVVNTNSDEAQMIINEKNSETDFSLVSHQSTDGKRKRKRVRKRKKNLSTVTTSPIIAPQPVPVFIDTSVNNKHIRFEENETKNENKCEEAVTIENNNQNLDENVVVPQQDIEQETILIETTESNEEKVLENTPETQNSENGINVFPKFREIQEEFVCKQPLMSNLPKIGNIISFKIYRLTQCYCPEISSYIVGKVVKVDDINDVVGFNVLVGLDQCQEPNGKLSIEIDESHPKENSVVEKFWTELLEPRLLYP